MIMKRSPECGKVTETILPVLEKILADNGITLPDEAYVYTLCRFEGGAGSDHIRFEFGTHPLPIDWTQPFCVIHGDVVTSQRVVAEYQTSGNAKLFTYSQLKCGHSFPLN